MKKVITYFILLGLVILIIGYGWYVIQMNKSYAVPAQELIIDSGLGVKQISSELAATGYIHNDFWFRTYVWQKGLEEKFIAGRYLLPEEISMRELVMLLTSNQTNELSQKFTFIEGWNASQAGNYLAEAGGYDIIEWYELVGYPLSHANNTNGVTRSKDYSEQFTFLQDKPAGFGLEGYLFPDTYQFALNASLEDVVMRQLETMDARLTEKMRADIAAQGKTIFEIITVASILERELRSPEEKKIGAGVIKNRLELGMLLQMDSTVNFVTGKNLPSVTFTDLEVDSPYNTYKYVGLPPGPIANPGLDSIMAAIYPTGSDYLYFLTDSDGVAHFASTLAGHNQNRVKYLD